MRRAALAALAVPLAALLAVPLVVSAACQSRDTVASSAAEEAELRQRASERAAAPTTTSGAHPSAAAGVPAAASADAHAHGAAPATATKGPYDLRFLDTMIVHHQHAVDMAALADGRTARPELKQAAAKMKADQQREIEQMKAWRASWYAQAPAAVDMGMPGMKQSMAAMDMAKLRAAKGDDFDHLFLDQMQPHHEGALVMAKDALQSAQREELKDFARKIIDEQQAEIAQMKAWRSTWFPGHAH